MRNPSNSRDFRSLMIASLRKDMIGPDLDTDFLPIENEVLSLSPGATPQQYYMTGFLEPRNWGDGEENIDFVQDQSAHAEGDTEEESGGPHGVASLTEMTEAEPDVSGRTIQAPSSMGISFVLGPGNLEKPIDIGVEWGQYEPDVSDPDEWRWTRTQISETLTLAPKELIGNNGIWRKQLDDTGVFLHVKSSELGDSRQHFTVRLVNGRKLGDDSTEKRGEATIFQTGLRVRSPSLEDARLPEIESDPTMALLYHDSTVLARGHNTSVDWNDEGEVWTEWIPGYEVRMTSENKALREHIPSMSELSSMNTLPGALDKLSGLVDEYSNWLLEVESWFAGPGQNKIGSSLHPTLKRNILGIANNIDRMRGGIELLRSSNRAAEAFVYANDSIARSQSCPAVGRPDFSWRPFQISYILLNLPGLLWDESNSVSVDRETVDLAWYPTGGGKTEAYFGLIATIGFYRHLCDVDRHPSVHAIMRYTLRLLTLNQGERAARLMVAMNMVSEDHDLGCREFSVGMWIGAGASPNRVSDARRILSEMYNTNSPNEKGISPILLQACPWCDHAEDEVKDQANLWKEEESSGRIRGKCSQQQCVLHTMPIPFSCIDDELYANPPTLLIGTIDKFARLASEPDSRVLLGLKHKDIHRRPPDLVIQDELHLLTGPLGSLAGLYEAAIETLWSSMEHRVKYIAATATTKGAEKDTLQIYGRNLNVFPPPGYSIDDNFFSKVDKGAHGREHIAILGNMNNSRTVLDKPLANLLQQPFGLLKKHPSMTDEIEPYWTTMVYFNSIRELAGARSALEDNVCPQWIPDYAIRNSQEPRTEIKIEELYSRKKSEELKRTLHALSFRNGHPGALDTCFTTNMFQVGVDIDRLGLMIINGQPKSNSEYIQASGRVGRKKEWPGLVLSVLRASKPRDLSHYEMHRAFHQEMYKYVDVTTTTPFSPRGMDRALPSILMLLIRQRIEECGPNPGIQELRHSHIESWAQDLVDRFVSVVADRTDDPDIRDIVEMKIRGGFKQLSDWVHSQAMHGNYSVWRSTNRANHKAWAKGFDSTNPDELNALDSMRDVGDEVWFGRTDRVFGKLPLAHVFSHALPGGLWDHEGQALMTEGLNRWAMTEHQRETTEIKEGVLQTMLQQYKVFRPPSSKSHGHITVRDFPWDFRCSAVPSHISYPNRNGKDWTCGHGGCDKPARPVRFVSLCSSGHLSPFNWNKWVSHRNNCNKSRLSDHSHIRVRLNSGHNYNLGSWMVICDECGGSRSLRGVTTSNTRGRYCNSYMPWIEPNNIGQDCLDIDGNHNMLSNRQRGSSSIALPEGGSILLIHPQVNWFMSSHHLVKSMISMGGASSQHFDALFETLCQSGEISDTVYNLDLTGSGGWDKPRFIQELDYCMNKPLAVRRETLRELERAGMAHGQRRPVDDGRHYLSFTEYGGEVVAGGVWGQSEWPVEMLSRLERLTELKYLTSVRRLDGSGGAQPLGVFPDGGHQWCLGDYNHGEGVYIGIKPEWISPKAEERSQSVDSGSQTEMMRSIEHTSLARELENHLKHQHAQAALPILHTLSHLIIKELCAKSGYSLGSIRERLYLESDESGLKKAGILLYTTGTSSDGTLGGLARQGRRGVMEVVIKAALRRLEDCSNDPICSENRPSPSHPNGAACHACVLLPESCCELGNKALDRIWR